MLKEWCKMVKEPQIPSQFIMMSPAEFQSLFTSDPELAAIDFKIDDVFIPGSLTDSDNMRGTFICRATNSDKSSEETTSDARDNTGQSSESVPENAIKITILHTNDIHGAKEKLQALSRIIKELKQESPDAVLVDSGDLAYSAKPIDDQFASVSKYLNENDYTAIVPGNHDFQWGKQVVVDELFSKVKSDVLCANILDKETGKPLPFTKPHVIKEINGVKVAFIGVTTKKMATKEQPEIGEDLITLEEVGILEREIALARCEGAQVFIALVHKGLTDMRDIKILASKLPELDLIVIGHDHLVEKASYRTGPWPHRTYIVEAGSYGNYIGKVDLYIDPESKKVIKADMRTFPTKKYIINTTGTDLGKPLENAGLWATAGTPCNLINAPLFPLE